MTETLRGVDEIGTRIGKVHEQNIVGRGVDVVFREADGRVQTVYVFMGID